jgi:hypothetical protein
MTTLQLPLTGLQLKEQGIESLERHRWVDEARKWAVNYCQATGAVTSDEVHFIMDVDYPPHVNCWGAIFHDKRFVATGERVRSKRPEAHGREIRVWRLA